MSQDFFSAYQAIAKVCNELNLTPLFCEPETYPGPRKMLDHATHLGFLIEKYGIQIPSWQLAKWRPLSKALGKLTHVVEEEVYILCTDGTVAWFVNREGQTLLGHLENFDGPKDYWAVPDEEDKEQARLDRWIDRLIFGKRGSRK